MLKLVRELLDCYISSEIWIDFIRRGCRCRFRDYSSAASEAASQKRQLPQIPLYRGTSQTDISHGRLSPKLASVVVVIVQQQPPFYGCYTGRPAVDGTSS